MLTPQNLNELKEQGYTVIPDVISESKITQCNMEIERWNEESRYYTKNYGALIDGRARFDLAAGHTRASPKLQRINNPVEVSEQYRSIVLEGKIPNLLTPILGPNIKFDHCKINAKYPGSDTKIGFHQDHAFEPQSNDSVVVAILMLDNTTVENGCLTIVPGSHNRQYSHYQNGTFTGKIDDRFAAEFRASARPIIASSGSLCLMDSWVVHGSDTNKADQPRRLLISEYKSADAVSLTQHKLPSKFMNSIILGEGNQQPRYRANEVELPPYYNESSFITLQNQHFKQTMRLHKTA